jgi:predicted PurR-regulated permease PerM
MTLAKNKSQTIGFFILLALAGLAVARIFWPFWELLALAIILAIIFHPLYARLAGYTKMPRLSAGVVVLIMALIIAGPVLLIGQQVFYELANFYGTINLGSLFTHSNLFMQNLPPQLRQLTLSFNADVNSWISQLASRAVSSLSGLLSGLGWMFGSLVVVAFSVYFLLRDGDKIKKLLKDILPLSNANENILFNKLTQAVNGVVKGQFLVVLTISVASFIGFSIFGLPNSLVWACAMFMAAFVPAFGTSLIWIPAVCYLYFTGHAAEAIGLAIWAVASVVLIDNILAAKIVSSRARLHPLLTIFAILGGVASFGVLGVLLGPILMAIFVALVEIYRTDIKGATINN